MNSTRAARRLLCGAAVAVLALAWAVPSRAQEPSINFEIKGQVFSETTDFGTGVDRQGSRTDIHFQRMRLVATAKLNDVWGFKFQTCGNCGTSKQGALGYAVTAQDTDWNDRDIRIIDGYVIADFSEQFRLKVGLTKIPLTRGNLDDCFSPLSQDRSFFVYSAYGSSPAKFSRDFGAVVWGGFNNDKLRYFAGAFQGREGLVKSTHPFSGATVTSSIEPKNSLEYVGRVHYAFLDAEPGGGYAGSYLGDLKVFTVGFGAAREANAVYKNVSSAGALVDTATANYTAYAADMMFEYPTEKAGMVTATAQYLKTDFEDAHLTNFNGGDRLNVIGGINGQKKGYYVKGAYMLPVTLGKAGRLQPYFVYEDWKFAFLLGITDQKIKQAGGGINYYIHGQNARLTAEYLDTKFGTETGFVGARVDPATFAPLDKVKSYKTFRVMLQVGVF
jgi:hypothetical protein